MFSLAEHLRTLAANQDFDEHSPPQEVAEILSFIEKTVTLKRRGEFGKASGVPFFYYGIEAKLGENNITGIGVERVYGRAVFSSIMEFFERYALADSDAVRVEKGSFAKMNGIAHRLLDPSLLVLSDNIEIKKTEFNWSAALELPEKKQIYVPSQLVFANYDAKKNGEPLLRESNLSGGASALTEEEAIVFGIYELIERDAFLRMWLTKSVPERIRKESIKSTDPQALIKVIEDLGQKVTLLSVPTQFEIPCFMALIVDERQRLVSRGLSVRLDPERALKKALLEAYGNLVFNSRLVKSGIKEKDVPEDSILFRYIVWIQPTAFDEIAFLLQGQEKDFPAEKSRAENELAFLLDSLKSGGLDIYYYPAVHPLTAPLNVHVVKVIIPQLLPFYFLEKNKGLILQFLKPEGPINTFPHPFA